jgi:hypothetical protein
MTVTVQRTLAYAYLGFLYLAVFLPLFQLVRKDSVPFNSDIHGERSQLHIFMPVLVFFRVLLVYSDSGLSFAQTTRNAEVPMEGIVLGSWP